MATYIVTILTDIVASISWTGSFPIVSDLNKPKHCQRWPLYLDHIVLISCKSNIYRTLPVVKRDNINLKGHDRQDSGPTGQIFKRN